jgi:hypothetical protein
MFSEHDECNAQAHEAKYKNQKASRGEGLSG